MCVLCDIVCIGLAYVHQLCAQEFNTVELDISTKYVS